MCRLFWLSDMWRPTGQEDLLLWSFIVHSALEKKGCPLTMSTQGNTSVRKGVEDAKGKDGPCRLSRLIRLSRLGLTSWILGF